MAINPEYDQFFDGFAATGGDAASKNTIFGALALPVLLKKFRLALLGVMLQLHLVEFHR
ncbi:hypothetical protein H8B14_18475 [Hymenobacter sp. BT190]|nr:hypothetical protein [Hymenobacter sp. BT190]